MKITVSSAPVHECNFSDFIFGRNICSYVEYDQEKGWNEVKGLKQYDLNLGEVPDIKIISKEDIEKLEFRWINDKQECIKSATHCAGISLIGDVFGYNWVQLSYTGACDLFMTSEKWKEMPYKIISHEEYWKSVNLNDETF